MAHSLRSAGSAAINIAFVASGGLDMYWEIGVSTMIEYPLGQSDWRNVDYS